MNRDFVAVSRPKSNQTLLKNISRRQVAKKLLEIGLSFEIGPISWKKIAL